MTIVIDVSYPFGYVHATPWGTHVNEGAVEWPPSPWRLLRALVATWRTRLPEMEERVMVPVLESLADPPAVWVAPRTEASVRSYLPSESHRRGASSPDVDLVVDAFAAVAPGTGVRYRWSAVLDNEAREALHSVVDALPYLGRAESVCDASVEFESDDVAWAEPQDDATGTGARSLVPATPFDLDGLCVSIRQMRKGGRLHPSGARWVRYDIPGPSRSDSSPRREPELSSVNAVRLRLAGPAPVSVRQSVVVADVARRAAMAMHDDEAYGGPSPVLAGKDADGEPLCGHGHAHWLPLDSDGDGLLDTVLVWAREGLGGPEVDALAAIRRLTFTPAVGSVTSLRVGLEIAGSLADMGIAAVTGTSDRWCSATPFLPQRHRKRESIEDFLHDCVERDMRHRGCEVPFDLVVERRTSWGSFRRYRQREGIRQARPGYGVSIRFERPVRGPICIGALSHFGLGRFEIDS